MRVLFCTVLALWCGEAQAETLDFHHSPSDTTISVMVPTSGEFVNFTVDGIECGGNAGSKCSVAIRSALDAAGWDNDDTTQRWSHGNLYVTCETDGVGGSINTCNAGYYEGIYTHSMGCDGPIRADLSECVTWAHGIAAEVSVVDRWVTEVWFWVQGQLPRWEL